MEKTLKKDYFNIKINCGHFMKNLKVNKLLLNFRHELASAESKKYAFMKL